MAFNLGQPDWDLLVADKDKLAKFLQDASVEETDSEG